MKFGLKEAAKEQVKGTVKEREDVSNEELKEAVRELAAALGKFSEAFPDEDVTSTWKSILQKHVLPVANQPAELFSLRAAVRLFSALPTLGQELRAISTKINQILDRET